MSTHLRSTIQAELGWSWQDRDGASLITNNSRLRLLQDFDDGSGVNEAEAVWDASEQTLPAGTALTFELDGLERILFGDAIYLSLLKVKAILIVNRNTSGSGYLLVGGAASDAWSAPFGAAGDKVKVMPGAPLFLACPQNGWDVEAGANQLKIAAVGATVVFDIAILGTRTADSSSSLSL